MREIYNVIAQLVDANGNYADLTGYPKAVDSKTYDGDTEKARMRAYAYWHDALGAMGKREDRQLQYACIIRVSDGLQIESAKYGAFAPDPEPEPEPEPEPTPEEGTSNE